MPFTKGHKFGKRFVKGFTPWNKGMKGKYSVKHSGQFKKGFTPWSKGRKGDHFAPFGENHYRWIKDRTLINTQERNNSEYKQWRYKVFKRDRHICRINNEDCDGKVVAHHILPWKDYSELRYEINNGITLCHFHHPKKRDEEVKLIQTFQGLVMQTN